VKFSFDLFVALASSLSGGGFLQPEIPIKLDFVISSTKFGAKEFCNWFFEMESQIKMKLSLKQLDIVFISTFFHQK